ncbi:uncharacterized protein LOC114521182 [Dendronephthya gigantea]|uniref:uncharacterized protein LOC114521182 n=1 Tax=Dendronephthya gigantea TaxID=151771 RepID=UPI00106B1D0B|nr:uncharacterized protein LOC114521182 [Dendronephthya gigantea]
MSLTGILLDVSGSMKENIESDINEESTPWAESIFKVIDDLIKHDLSSENRVFAVGFGADCQNREIFDVIGTIHQLGNMKMPAYHEDSRAEESKINEVFNILEKNGARSIRKWAKDVSLIQKVVSDVMASLILKKLKTDEQFLKEFVYEILPKACRDIADPITQRDPATLAGQVLTTTALAVVFSPFLAAAMAPAIFFPDKVEDVAKVGASAFREATEKDIEEIVEKVKCLFLKGVSSNSIFSVKNASNIIRGYVDEKELTKERAQQLLENVKPFIYGRTPLYQSLKEAVKFFKENNSETNKLLFIVSDGIPTDGSNKDIEKINQITRKLKEADVKVVSSFITRSRDIQPKRLYDTLEPSWESGAKFLFRLSSEVPTQLLPRAILVKQDWKIDIANNETKLFMQVNHPDNLREACEMAQNVCCTEFLSELLVSIDLDIYINQTTGGFKAQKQEGGTCYANASAAALHLAMHRILGREAGYPEFNMLRKEMIDAHGKKGANTEKVLKEMCSKYRLHSKKVGITKAKEAIVKKRPVVARFSLTDDEWHEFSEFYRNDPEGVLTRNKLDKRKRPKNAPTRGHAVVLTSYSSKCLILMNSWGEEWADNGFFRVQNAEVLQLEFFDVYWTLNDLTEREKEYYRKHGHEVAQKLMDSLKGLQNAKYTCPECHEESLVTEFTGKLTKVQCPRCYENFSTNDNAGNILALNMYLTILSK